MQEGEFDYRVALIYPDEKPDPMYVETRRKPPVRHLPDTLKVLAKKVVLEPPSPPITGDEYAVEFVREHIIPNEPDNTREWAKILYLNTRHQIVAVRDVTDLTEFKLRDVLVSGVLVSAYAVVTIVYFPQEADRHHPIVKRIGKSVALVTKICDFKLLDMILIDPEGYISMKASGIMPYYEVSVSDDEMYIKERAKTPKGDSECDIAYFAALEIINKYCEVERNASD